MLGYPTGGGGIGEIGEHQNKLVATLARQRVFLANNVAQSLTDRAITPTESSVVERGSTPSRDTASAVGLNPVNPHSAAGIRMEPPVSVPMATGAMPSATDTAAPDDEPPGIRRSPGNAGLLGVP